MPPQPHDLNASPPGSHGPDGAVFACRGYVGGASTFGDETSFLDVEEPRFGGLFVSTAAKLYARTGEWPGWFLRAVRAVGAVPRGYVLLALHYRRELERELGVVLPIRRRPPPAVTPHHMEQLGMEHVTGPTGKPARARRGAS